MSVRDAIYYDLEGPISSQDHAQAVCKRFVREGDKLFPVLSRYDDVLTLANKEGYEPGDTLMLLIPFFVEGGVAEKDLRVISAEAGLVPEVCELFNELQNEDCSVWIISTSYEQHAFSIASRVRVPLNRVYCTEFPLDDLQGKIDSGGLNLVQQTRENAIQLYREDLGSGINDEPIQKLLDFLFWEMLPKTKLGQVMAGIKVMGGRRKVRALEKAIQASGGYLDEAFIVVDSITDFRMAQAVEAAGGIALAWNGNQYIIPYASCGVAAVDARTVKPLFQAWREGGRKAVREVVESMAEPEDSESGPYYHWLAGRSSEFHQEVLAIHKRLRIICRGAEVARLG
jgi:energy-converting hydrogenase A subunit R